MDALAATSGIQCRFCPILPGIILGNLFSFQGADYLLCIALSRFTSRSRYPRFVARFVRFWHLVPVLPPPLYTNWCHPVLSTGSTS
jgi:hypothetical protein